MCTILLRVPFCACGISVGELTDIVIIPVLHLIGALRALRTQRVRETANGYLTLARLGGRPAGRHQGPLLWLLLRRRHRVLACLLGSNNN